MTTPLINFPSSLCPLSCRTLQYNYQSSPLLLLFSAAIYTNPSWHYTQIIWLYFHTPCTIFFWPFVQGHMQCQQRASQMSHEWWGAYLAKSSMERKISTILGQKYHLENVLDSMTITHGHGTEISQGWRLSGTPNEMVGIFCVNSRFLHVLVGKNLSLTGNFQFLCVAKPCGKILEILQFHLTSMGSCFYSTYWYSILG